MKLNVLFDKVYFQLFTTLILINQNYQFHCEKNHYDIQFTILNVSTILYYLTEKEMSKPSAFLDIRMNTIEVPAYIESDSKISIRLDSSNHQNEHAVQKIHNNKQSQHVYRNSAEVIPYAQDCPYQVQPQYHYFNDKVQHLDQVKINSQIDIPSNFPYECIGLLRSQWYNEQNHLILVCYGTGFLISDRILVTCGHSVISETLKKKCNKVSFIPGVNGRIGNTKVYSSVKENFLHFFQSQLNQTSSVKPLENDIAMIFLEEPVKLNKYLIIQPNNSISGNLKVIVSGYPSKKFNSERCLEKVNAKRQSISGQTLQFQGGDSHYLYYNISMPTQVGHSGSPVLMQIDNTYVVVGIHTHKCKGTVNSGELFNEKILIQMQRFYQNGFLIQQEIQVIGIKQSLSKDKEQDKASDKEQDKEKKQSSSSSSSYSASLIDLQSLGSIKYKKEQIFSQDQRQSSKGKSYSASSMSMPSLNKSSSRIIKKTIQNNLLENPIESTINNLIQFKKFCNKNTNNLSKKDISEVSGLMIMLKQKISYLTLRKPESKSIKKFSLSQFHRDFDQTNPENDDAKQEQFYDEYQKVMEKKINQSFSIIELKNRRNFEII